jgi:periplasmic protein TonB
MFRLEEGTPASAARRPPLRLVPETAPRLFQVQKPDRRLLLPSLLAIVVHGAAFYWALEQLPARAAPKKAVTVVFKRPPPPKPAPAGGGAPARPAKARRKKLHVPVPPPKLEEPPPPPQEPEPEPPVEEVGEDDGEAGGTGLGSGAGTGTGIGSGMGSGTGPGTGAPSKERKAWLESTHWKCARPGHEDIGRVVVKLRVEVLPDGKPGEVTVTQGGPEPFNRRAIDCAKSERYISALDREGHPFVSAIEFGIAFEL